MKPGGGRGEVPEGGDGRGEVLEGHGEVPEGGDSRREVLEGHGEVPKGGGSLSMSNWQEQMNLCPLTSVNLTRLNFRK